MSDSNALDAEIAKTQSQVQALQAAVSTLKAALTDHLTTPETLHPSYILLSDVGDGLTYAAKDHQHPADEVPTAQATLDSIFTSIDTITSTAQNRVDALAEVTHEVFLTGQDFLHASDYAELVSANPASQVCPSSLSFRTVLNRYQTISHTEGDLIALEFVGVLGPTSTQGSNDFADVRTFLVKLDVTGPGDWVEGPWEGKKFTDPSTTTDETVRVEGKTIMFYVAPHTGESTVRTGVHYKFTTNASFYTLDSGTGEFKGLPVGVFRVRKMGNIYGN